MLSRDSRTTALARSLCPRRSAPYPKASDALPYIIRHVYGLGQGLIACLETHKLLKGFGTLERPRWELVLFQNKHNSRWVCKFAINQWQGCVDTRTNRALQFQTQTLLNQYNYWILITFERKHFLKKPLWSVNSFFTSLVGFLDFLSPFISFPHLLFHLNIYLPS